MKIHQIRNATIIVTFNNKRFLLDPWLMPKNFIEGFRFGVNYMIRQPRVGLPISIEEIVDVDAVILTHYSFSNWDFIAEKALDKNLPFFVQNEWVYDVIKDSGFKNLEILSENGTEFENIKLFKTGCQAGPRETVKSRCDMIGVLYDSMGVVFKSDNEKTLYVAGDTIWCKEVEFAIDTYKPDVIVIDACGATAVVGDKKEKISMGVEDVKTISEYAKSSVIVASHMDTVSYITYKRDKIKNLELPNVVVPDDNEILEY